MRYANVMSTAAMFVALGGVGYAAAVSDNSVQSRHVVNSSLTGNDIKNGSLYGSDLADGTITGADVKDGLPGKASFTFNDAPVVLDSGQVGKIVASVRNLPKGPYLVQAQINTRPALGQPSWVNCNIFDGTDITKGDARLYGGGGDSRTTPTNGSRVVLNSFGVTQPDYAGGDISVGCGMLNGEPATVTNARLVAIPLRGVVVAKQP